MEVSEIIILFLDIDGVLLPFGCSAIDDGSSPTMFSSSSSCLFPDSTLQALSMILEECRERNLPPVGLVLSSTWRVHEKFRQDILHGLANYARRQGGPLGEVTEFFDVTDPTLHSERQHEIYAWLESYIIASEDDQIQQQSTTTSNTSCSDTAETRKVRPFIRAWLALDDEELIQGPNYRALSSVFQGHVIKTDSSVGLTREDAQQALELLQWQIQKRRVNRTGLRGIDS